MRSPAAGERRRLKELTTVSGIFVAMPQAAQYLSRAELLRSQITTGHK